MAEAAVWISVRKKLPQTGAPVLVWIPAKRPLGATVLIQALSHVIRTPTRGQVEYWMEDGEVVITDRDPTHWMPLPKGPTDV